MINLSIASGDANLALRMQPALRGKSAYDVAVDNGFVGTQVQWLAAIMNPTALPLTPQNFGAIVGADCSRAVSDWLDELTTRQAVGRLPAGDYYLESAVAKAVAAQRFGIVGDGFNVSRFIVRDSNPDGGIILTSSSRSGQVLLRDFTVIGQGQGGIGLAYTQPEGGSQHQCAVLAENVVVSGADGTNDWFDVSMDLTGTWRPYIHNVQLSGPYIGVDNTTTSNRFAGSAALRLGGAYDPTINKLHAWGAYRLIDARAYEGAILGVVDRGGGRVRVQVSAKHPFSTGAGVVIAQTTSYNGTFTATNVDSTHFDITAAFVASETGIAYASQEGEAFRLANSVLNGCRIGFDFKRHGREPIIWLTDTHINYRDDGANIDGAKLVVVKGFEGYNEDLTREYAGVPHDLALRNASEYEIVGNNFHFDGNNKRIAIYVESETAGEGDNGIIDDNNFSGTFDWAVWLSLNVNGTKVGDNNNYSGTFVSGHVNDVSTNNDIGREAVGTWTPSLTFGGASTGITYSTRTGTYQVDGGVLTFQIDIVLTSKGSAAGNAEVSLPTSLPGSKLIQVNGGAGSFAIYNLVSGFSNPIARPVTAGLLRLMNQGATAVINMTDANFTNTSSFTITGELRLA